MEKEACRPPVQDILEMLADLLTERYFERMDERMRKIPELRRLMTAKEASQYLSLSTDTLYRMAASKKLPYLKIGDRVLFDIKALDQWIDKKLIREKDWKRQEIKAEIGKGKPELEGGPGEDLLGMLDRT